MRGAGTGGIGALGSRAGALACGGAAPAAALPSQTVTAPSAVDRSCTSGRAQRRRSGPHPVRHADRRARDRPPERGEGRLGRRNRRLGSGRLVAGSAYSGADELASGFAAKGSRLVVQSCRLSGGASTARLTLDTTPIDTSHVQKVQLVRVSTANLARKNELNRPRPRPDGTRRPRLRRGRAVRRRRCLKARGQQLRLHRRGAGHGGPVAAGPRRGRPVRGRQRASEFPSGRTSYRRLFDYSEDMKRARARAPGPRPSDHSEPQDLRGPPGRGHRDRDEPERPRRPPCVPADGRAPRA